MAARANWKGHLAIGELRCHVALFTAASTADRVQFHMINRETGHRIRRQMVDSDTGEEVENDDIVKGYDLPDGGMIILEPEDIEAVTPTSDKTLDVEAFIACSEIDTTFFDKPYYLAPADAASAEAFALIRDGLDAAGVAALSRTVLFRRLRTLLIRPHGQGLIAATLNYDYEVRDPADVFSAVPKTRLKGEMLDLAKHIITTKMGSFDPEQFQDRYEDALTEMIKAKIEGRKIKRKPPPKETKVSDLMEALRRSAGGKAAAKTPAKAKAAARRGTRRKAG